MIIVGDCRDVMAGMDAESIDAIVTDPPYGLSFMGKEWDHGVPGVPFWSEAIRVLKPGGYLLAFGGTRTFHRLSVAIEDAGFEIRDCLSWLYGSGFPKSHNLNGDHAGWGTALKPGWEPIIVARKPLIGTVAANVMQHGTGALNVDACRIATDENLGRPLGNSVNAYEWNKRPNPMAGEFVDNTRGLGRWPANVALDEAAAAILDAQSGERPGCKNPSTVKPTSKFRPDQGQYMPQGPIYGDTGGASRFFYVAKASRSERNKGLDGMPERINGRNQSSFDGGTMLTGSGNPRNEGTANHHPTVKPIALMRWLVRLVTPPGGTVLDPFAGSGSTGCAAALEGFDFVGIEMDAEYASIAERRIAYWQSIADRPAQLQMEFA